MDLQPNHSKEEIRWKQPDTGVLRPTDELIHMERKSWENGEN